MATAYSKPLQYTPYQEQWNKELLAKALQYKQDKYDFNREKVKNTIGQTLRLDLIKDQDSEYLYDRLQSVVNTLNTQGLGDLSLDGRADYLSGYVAQVADQRVLNGYLGTQKVRRLQEEAEAAKKTGEYSDINYSYSMKDLSAWVNDGQVGSAVPAGANTSYVPFVDKFDVLQEVADKLKPNSVVRFEPFGGSGYTWYSQNGDILDEDELISAFNLKIASDPKLADQFRVDSWAQNQGVSEEDFLADTRESYLDYTDYYQKMYSKLEDAKNTTAVTEEKEYLQQQMDVVKENIEYYEELSARSDEDILARREDIEYNNYRTDYLQVLANTLAYEQWDKPSLEVDRGAIAQMQERGANARHTASLAADMDGKILSAFLTARNKFTETGDEGYMNNVASLYGSYVAASAKRGGVGMSILLKEGKTGAEPGDYYDLSTVDGRKEYINDIQAYAVEEMQTTGVELEDKEIVTVEDMQKKQNETLKTQRAMFQNAMSKVYTEEEVNRKMQGFDKAVREGNGALANFMQKTREGLDPIVLKQNEFFLPQTDEARVANEALNMVNSADKGMQAYVALAPSLAQAVADQDSDYKRILRALKSDESMTFVVEAGGLLNNRYMVWDKGKWQWKQRNTRQPLQSFYTDEAAIDFLKNYFAENPEDIADSFIDTYGEANTILGNFFYKLGDTMDNFQQYTFNGKTAGELILDTKASNNARFERVGLNTEFARSSYGIDLTSGEGRRIIADLAVNNANSFLPGESGVSVQDFMALATNPAAMETAQAAAGEGFSKDSKDLNKIRIGGDGEISLEPNEEGGTDIKVSLGTGRGGSYEGAEIEARIPLADFNLNSSDYGAKLVSQLIASSAAFEEANEMDQVMFSVMPVSDVPSRGYTAYSTSGIGDTYFDGTDGRPELQTQLQFHVNYNKPSADNQYITVVGEAKRFAVDANGNFTDVQTLMPGGKNAYKNNSFIVNVTSEQFATSDAANAYINDLIDNPIELQTLFFNVIDMGFNEDFPLFEVGGEKFSFKDAPSVE